VSLRVQPFEAPGLCHRVLNISPEAAGVELQMTQNIESGLLVVRSGRLITWTASGDNLLGTMPDLKLASMLNIARTSVLARRLELSTPAFVTQKQYTWNEKEIKLLGTMTDVDVGLAIGKPAQIVATKRVSLDISRYGAAWTESNVSLLGTMYDKNLAEQSGFSQESVSRKRRALGISPFRYIQWSEQMLGQLGKMSDLKVAKALGVSDSAVFQKRQALGIPAAN
jgi:hypothetical protein